MADKYEHGELISELQQNFIKHLDRDRTFNENSYLYQIYKLLFSMVSPKIFDFDIKYICSEYIKYSETTNPTQWVTNWHKSLRQTDYFDNINMTITMKPLTDEELASYKKGIKIYRDRGRFNEKYIKQDENNDFTKEYKNFLELGNKYIESKTATKSVCAQLDMILYNTFNMDKGEIIVAEFIAFFKLYKVPVGDDIDQNLVDLIF